MCMHLSQTEKRYRQSLCLTNSVVGEMTKVYFVDGVYICPSLDARAMFSWTNEVCLRNETVRLFTAVDLIGYQLSWFYRSLIMSLLWGHYLRNLFRYWQTNKRTNIKNKSNKQTQSIHSQKARDLITAAFTRFSNPPFLSPSYNSPPPPPSKGTAPG